MNAQIHYMKCRRCDYRWAPRKTEVRVCPKCHSPYWDRPRGGENPSPIRPILDEMVRRIVKACRPERIILFGSHATGHAGPGSDVDLLIVTRHGKTKREQAATLYEILWDVGMSKDIVVVRPEEFEEYQDVIGTILYPAVREGKVLYERAA